LLNKIDCKNDIIGILNLDGELVATYSYDGWGNCTVNNLTSSNIGDLNPFRYRSYYYDTETGYYYLNSRYYDSNVGRFINSDEISNLGVNNDVQSLNVYAYCANNPIHRYDEAGDVWEVILFGTLVGMGTQIISNVIEGKPWYEEVVGATVGGAVSVALGGIGGIMISNAINVSLNYIQANICGYSYTNEDTAMDLISGMTLEIVIESITGTVIDTNNKYIYFADKDVDIRLSTNFKAKTTDEMVKLRVAKGVDYLSIMLDADARLVVDSVNYLASTGVNKNPTPPKNLFMQSRYNFLR